MPTPKLPPLAERAAAELEAVAGEVLSAVSALQRSQRWGDVVRGLASLAAVVGAGEPDDDEEAEAPEPAADEPAVEPALGIEAVGGLARGVLFSPEALVSDGEEGPVFALRLPEPGADASDEEALLARLVNGLELSTHVRERDDGAVDVVFAAGGADKPLLTLAVGRGRLDVVVDLAQARGALSHVASALAALADEQEELDLHGLELRELKGVVSVGVSAPGAARLVVDIEVRRDVKVEGAVPAGPVHLRLAATRPWLQLENDGARGVGTLRLNVGAVSLKVPTAEDDAPAAVLHAKLAGLTADVELKGRDAPITVANLSLGGGTAVLSRDDEPVAFFELNKAAGNRVGLSLSPAAGRLDVSTQTAVALGLGWDGDTWALSAPKGTLMRLTTQDEGEGDGGEVLAVVEGELSLAVEGGRPVKVPAGKTLVLLDEDAGRKGEPHPVLRLLEVR